MAKLDYTKGVITLTNTGVELKNLDRRLYDKHYVSDILLGTTETLFVKMDFASWQKKTEVEVKIKVKILFFSIAATMKYIVECGDAAGYVEVVRISTYKNTVDRREFRAGSFAAATSYVEGVEKDFAKLATSLASVPNEKLHRIYSLLPFKRDYKNYIADTATKLFNVKVLLNHQNDAQETVDFIETIKKDGLSQTCQTDLVAVKNTAKLQVKAIDEILKATATKDDTYIRQATEKAINGRMPHHFITEYFSVLNSHNVPF